MNINTFQKLVLKKYSLSSSCYLNRYLASIAGVKKDIFPEFNVLHWEEIATITSTIYNAPLQSGVVYQAFKPRFDDLDSETITPVKRKDATSSINLVINSTTNDSHTLQYLTPFRDETCCVSAIFFHQFPILDISSISEYEYQNEVMLPPYIRVYTDSKRKLILDEITTDNIIKCTLTKGDKRILNKECLDRPIKREIDTTRSVIKVIAFERQFMDSINTILRLYYNCDPRALHGFIHICNTMIISSVLFLDYVEQIKQNIPFDDVKKGLKNIIIAALFHDSGRNCRDGVDEWERKSLENMRDVLSLTSPKNIVDEICDIMTSENNVLHDIMKGADSIDIARTNSYNPDRNPIAHSTHYQNLNKILIRPDTLVEEFNSITEIMNTIIKSVKLHDTEAINDLFINYQDLNFNGTIEFPEDGVCTIDTESLIPFSTYKGISKRYFDPITTPPKTFKRTVKEDIIAFNESTKTMCSYFIEHGYFADENRYFDDYMEVLLCFLPVIPYTLVHLSKVIFPFKTRSVK